MINFSRNPSDFPINRWIQIVPVKKKLGYYLVLTAEEAARVINVNNADFTWADGNQAPDGNDNSESFEFKTYETQRFAFPFNLGYQAQEQAEWPILAAHSAIHAAKAMTARAIRAISVVTNASNYSASHQSTATALVGGLLQAGTTADPKFLRALNAAAQVINLDTLGTVRADQLKVVIGPDLALLLATSAEFRDYIKSSPAAEKAITEGIGPNIRYGLPPQIYGYDVVVEDTVRVTTKKGITTVRQFAWPATSLAVMSRVGGLEGTAGGPSFSSVTQFTLEDMTVESRDDPDNRRTNGRVVDETAAVMTAPVSGYLVTNT